MTASLPKKGDENHPVSMTEIMEWLKENVQDYCNNTNNKLNIPRDARYGNTINMYNDPSYRVSVYINDTFTQTSVPSSTVLSQMDSFLSSRGLTNRVGSVATTKSVLNLFNNVASFLSAKTQLLHGVVDGKALCYNKNSTPEPTTVNVTAKGKPASIEEQLADEVTKAQAKQIIDDFVRAITTNNHARLIGTNRPSWVCSCSSSSCSCSSSSSSCSSSSSSYIVYMVI